MKKAFRFLLLLLVIFALYAGISSQVWSYPIGIIAFCCLCFIATLGRESSSISLKRSKSRHSSAVFGSSATSHFSSGSDCGSSDGGC